MELQKYAEKNSNKVRVSREYIEFENQENFERAKEYYDSIWIEDIKLPEGDYFLPLICGSNSVKHEQLLFFRGGLNFVGRPSWVIPTDTKNKYIILSSSKKFIKSIKERAEWINQDFYLKFENVKNITEIDPFWNQL